MNMVRRRVVLRSLRDRQEFLGTIRWYRSRGSLNHRLMAVIPSGSGLCVVFTDLVGGDGFADGEGSFDAGEVALFVFAGNGQAGGGEVFDGRGEFEFLDALG